jgi:hypothetical protein
LVNFPGLGKSGVGASKNDAQPKGGSLQTIKLAGARDQIAKRPSEGFPDVTELDEAIGKAATAYARRTEKVANSEKWTGGRSGLDDDAICS